MIGRVSLLILIVLLGSGSVSSQTLDRNMLRWLRQKPPPVIDSIVIEGNQAISDGTIKSRLYSKRRNLWLAIKGERRSRVQRETLARDTLEVKYLYLTRGFLNATITETFEIMPKDSAALVRIRIDEGSRFYYGRKLFDGEYSPPLEFHFNKVSRRLEPGKPINPFDVRQVVFDIRTYLANRGYPYSKITFDVDSVAVDGKNDIRFHVNTDSLVQFGGVTISGTSQYPAYVARRELKIKQGAVYRRDDILESQRRLFESGYFLTFQLNQAKNSGDRLRPDFDLRVRERKARYITFTTGAGQSTVRDLQWDFSGGFGKRNLFRSRRVDMRADYSFSLGSDTRLVTHRYRLRYTEPWFLGIRMPLVLTGELRPKLRDQVQDFKLTAWSLSARTSKRFGSKVRAQLGIEYESVEISDAPADSIRIIKLQDTLSVRRKVDFAIRRDSRDDIFIPRRGVLLDFKAEFFGGFLGGDDNFFKLEGSWSKYLVVWPGWISATRLRGTWAEAFGESDFVPLDESFYLGGANTIRSFEENRLGPPFVSGDPTGVNFGIVFNQEFRWRTVQVLKPLPLLGHFFESLPLWQSVFIDIGGGFDRSDQIKLKDFAYVYGTGFQIVSPAGPIRLDYARRVKTEKFDFADRWHFTILYAF